MLTVRAKAIKNGNKIVYYEVQDTSTLNVMRVSADQLKKAITNKQCNCVNLTLTSDGRLMPHEETTQQVSKTSSPKKPTVSLADELKKLATDDYQHRGGGYPSSGKAVDIQVYGNNVEASFKNTSEGTAKSWLKKFLENNGYKIDKLDSCQDGDYHDDWVRAYCIVTSKR